MRIKRIKEVGSKLSITVEPKKPLNSDADQSEFERFLKPKVAAYLKAAGLDKAYERAEGDYLYYWKGDFEHKVTDFLGGYGVSLFGHNHPELTKVAVDALTNKKPFASQASIRSDAGRLAKRLAELLEKSTGVPYMATLANSGAEAVEAAIKHAVFEKQGAIKAILEAQAESFKKLRVRKENVVKENLTELYRQAASLLDVPDVKNLEHLSYVLQKHNEQVFSEQVCFFAVEGSFHGKSSGAIKLTSNQNFRAPWVDFGINVKFVKRNDINSIEVMISDMARSYIAIDFDRFSGANLVVRPWSLVAGCFAEPIQGEGGIHELDIAFLQSLASAANHFDFPLIMDEIQSGMGRTGQFLASEASGVVADYYLFSKALGGGIAKIAALMIKHERYIEDFGYLHSSTFAEDDFSSLVALKALDLLEADNARLMQDCLDKGSYLKNSLEQLVQDYPTVFKEVRGRGLMLGLELLPQTTSKSRFLSMASEQSLLAYLICGYLLNIHHIRIAPTLSAELSLRIEPSAYIAMAELDVLVSAFRDIGEKLKNHDSHVFVSYLVGEMQSVNKMQSFDEDVSRSSLKIENTKEVKETKTVIPNISNISKVACIAHFMDDLDLVRWDPYLAPLSGEACRAILEKTQGLLEPFLFHKQHIKSGTGDIVELNLVGIPYTAEQIIQQVRGGQAKEMLAVMTAAYDYAIELGASQVGFTGYSSIATNNCTAIFPDGAGLTSGNSLTAALALDALHEVMDEVNIVAQNSTLAVVGGAGNIGRILAEIEAEHFSKLILVGRQGSERRLKKLATRIYEHAFERLLAADSVSGIAKTLEEYCLLNNLHFESATEASEYFLKHDIGIIKISTDMQDLQKAQAIITATNTPDALIYPEHLPSESTIICDVSVPVDVAKEVLDMKHVTVINGGRVTLPLQQALDVEAMPLQNGELYACIAETLLLGFEGVKDSFSYGALEKAKVKKIRRLSREHGFEVRTQLLQS